MEEVKLTKQQEILFEVYDKGVQQEDCDLNAYVEKMNQALSIAFVSKRLEWLEQQMDETPPFKQEQYDNLNERHSKLLEAKKILGKEGLWL